MHICCYVRYMLEIIKQGEGIWLGWRRVIFLAEI